LEPRRRAEQALVAVVQEAYVNGISTRKVDRLVAQRVVDVAPALTAQGRRRSRTRGKDDQTDAVAIARVARQEPGCTPCWGARAWLPGNHWRPRQPASACSRPPARRAGRTHRRRPARLAVAAIARLEALEGECAGLATEISGALKPLRPTRLLAICGVGPLTAAKLMGETHGTGRFASAAAFAAHAGTAPVPASSGRVVRHRLALGGNRQLNRALFTVAMCQARWDPAARAYLARKRAEGKSPAEARRCLKRHLANVVFRAMAADEHARRARPATIA
jgi:transposase